MFQKMLQVGGGGGDTFPSYEQHNIQVHGGRCNIESGGYFVKNNMAYIDLIITALATTTDNQAALKGFPVPKYSSNAIRANIYNVSNNSFYSTKVIELASNVVYLDSGFTNGVRYRIVTSYITDEADTV